MSPLAVLALLSAATFMPTRSAFAQSAASSAGNVIDMLIILLVVLAGMAFLFRKKLRAQFQRDRDRLSRVAASPEGMQKLRAQMKGVRTVALVLAVPTVLVTILLLVKINNTSNWALRYDAYVHEQLGWWFMGAGLLWLLTLAASGLWFAASRNFGRMSMDRVAAIRARLVEVEKELEARADGTKADLRAERQVLESELRQLGA